MHISREKFLLAQARACKGTKELIAAGIPRGTLAQVWKRDVRPETVGRIAAVLGCDVLDIIVDENEGSEKDD